MRPSPIPLKELPVEEQERIERLAAQEKRPPRWINLGFARLPSRAWYEWHVRRGLSPSGSDRKVVPKIRQQVIARDGLVCGLCGGTVEETDVHIDHIKPVAYGGLSELGNLQVTHSRCNIKKGAG